MRYLTVTLENKKEGVEGNGKGRVKGKKKRFGLEKIGGVRRGRRLLR
jgi:hypothetical protein